MAGPAANNSTIVVHKPLRNRMGSLPLSECQTHWRKRCWQCRPLAVSQLAKNLTKKYQGALGQLRGAARLSPARPLFQAGGVSVIRAVASGSAGGAISPSANAPGGSLGFQKPYGANLPSQA